MASASWVIVTEDGEHLISAFHHGAMRFTLNISMNGQQIVTKNAYSGAGLKGKYMIPIRNHQVIVEISSWLKYKLFLDGREIPSGERVVINSPHKASSNPSNNSKGSTLMDELIKLANLKDQGIIDEEEFKKLKEKLMQN